MAPTPTQSALAAIKFEVYKRIMSYNQMLGIGSLLVIAVFVPLAVLAIAVIKSLLPHQCKKRWPYLIGIAAAWFGTSPACGWFINATDLAKANWGHAG